jgi:hypothetical protein
MSDTEILKAEIKKLSMLAVQSKMDLHDLSEELPTNWQRIMEVAQRCYDLHYRLAEAREEMKKAAAG